MPAGTVVRFTAVYDNSAANPLNPDPASAVGWGRGTNDEMSIGKMWFTTDEQDADITIERSDNGESDVTH